MGGPGSGNFGHGGRPGEVGGSSSEGGTGKETEFKEVKFKSASTTMGKVYHEVHPGEHYSNSEVRVIQEKYGRMEKGKGALRTVETEHDLDVILNDGRYGLVSAGANTKDTPNGAKDKDKPPEFFQERHNSLKKDLIENGYQFTEVLGKYGEREDSFLIMTHETNKADLLSLGAKYNQDSIIFADRGAAEMIFTSPSYYEKDDGTRVPVRPGEAHVANTFINVPGDEGADFYTQVPIGGDGYARFSLDFDFSKTIPTQLPRSNPDYRVSKPIDNRQVSKE